MKRILAAVLIMSLVGCASADQKMASKQDYRRAQVEAIRVQSDARVSREQVQALEKQAMWNALAEVVKANPEAASNVAIVAAVAAARDGGEGEATETGMALIKTETDVTALDWAKVLVPSSINALTNVGIAALQNRTQRTAIRADAQVDMMELEVEGRIYDVLGQAASTPTYSVGGDYVHAEDEAVIDMSYDEWNEYIADSSTTTITEDNNNVQDYGFLVDGEYDRESHNSSSSSMGSSTPVSYQGETMSVESVVEYLASLGSPYSLTVDGAVVASSTEGTGTEVTVECSSVMFSPKPPECT